MPDRHFRAAGSPGPGVLPQAGQASAAHVRHGRCGRPGPRAAEVLGDRAAERFLLSDAQFVLAQEHGFRTWAEFRTRVNRFPRPESFVAKCLCVSFDVLHGDDDLPVRALRDRVPDGQTVRRKVKA